MSCAGTIALGGALLWLAAGGEPTGEAWVIGTQDSFPPYVMRDETGTLTGFDVEVMTEICARAQHECNWEFAPFAELIPGVVEGRFDVVLGGMAITPERRRQVDFSIPYTWGGEEEWFIGFPDAPLPEEATISVESDTIHEAWLRNERLDFYSYSSEAAVLEAVASGKSDLALGPFTNRTDLDHAIAGRGLDYLWRIEIPDEGTGIAVCKGADTLKAEIDQAITAMTEDGTFDRLNERWF